jgi:hypothetical protein
MLEVPPIGPGAPPDRGYVFVEDTYQEYMTEITRQTNRGGIGPYYNKMEAKYPQR